MFVVSDFEPVISFDGLVPSPVAVHTYVLEDEARILCGRSLHEYAIVYRAVPVHLNEVIRKCLEAARSAGARVAWLAFEGSFDFGFLLVKEIANQVYAIFDSNGISIASDDELSSKEWELRVVRAGVEARAGRVCDA